MEDWYVRIEGEAVGPLLTETVTRALEAGKLGATTNVRPASSTEWVEARTIPRFIAVLPAPPVTPVAVVPAVSVSPAVVPPPVRTTGAFETSGALNALVGQELAGFRLTTMLGEGGMAVVFRGENTLDSTITRAIKVVRPELSSNPEFVKRFTEEARTLERLQHPNVVRFYGLRRERGLLVMELELLSGDSLVSYMKRAPRGLPLEEAIRLMSEAADGVAAAHAMGVVHRDLKPENLYLTSAGPLKVLDFGIARAIDDADRAGKLTQVGMTLGTPAYMAPEVCNGATPSETADVYALGLTLFEVLAGFHPLLPEGSARLSSAQMMFAQVNKSVPSLASARPDAPATLGEVVARAVAKDPRDRFPDAASLAVALRGVRVMTPAHPNGAGMPAMRADLANLRAPAQSYPDVGGQSTSFALPAVGGNTPAGGRPRLASSPMLAPDGANTSFGLPLPSDSDGTGQRRAISGDLEPRGKKKSTVALAAVALGAVAGSALVMFALSHGKGGEHPESTEARGASSAEVAPSGSAPAMAAPSSADNKWIRIEVPSVPLTLGVPDNTPAAVRGIRRARKMMAPASAYDMQQHEVTWGEIAPWLAKNPTQKVVEPPGLPTDAAARKMLPVTGISWEAARFYCKSIGGTLPREEEWEYAARGPKLRRFPWGDQPLDLERTNAFAGKGAKLKPVMTSDEDQTPEADAVALFDMMGNAREWTADLYREDSPPKTPGTDESSWVQDGNMTWRTVRGLPLEEKAGK